MHIVLVSREYLPTLRGGGIASYLKEVAGAYINMGYQVTVICSSDDTRLSSDSYINGIRVIRLPGGDFIVPQIETTTIIKLFRSFYRFHTYRKKIRRVILELKDVDIIEVAEFGAESHYLHDLKIPVVMRLHTPTYTDRLTAGKIKFPIHKFMLRYLADKEEENVQKAQYITSCSESLKKWTHEYFNIDNDKITTVYNPIQISDWIQEPTSFIKSRRIDILFVGTVAAAKGIQDLIDACSIARVENPELTLSIVGKLGEYALGLKERCKNKKWCTFLGNQPREELKKLYRNCDMACFPSWWEAMGLVCTEAMASGCIVIGSNAGGMSEIINDGKDGFLVPPHDPKRLAQIITQIIHLDENRKVEISQKAKETVIERFSNDVIIKQMLEFYQFAIKDFKTKYAETTLDNFI